MTSFLLALESSISPNSAKQGDSNYKPSSRSAKTDWPTVVFESGFFETLTRLGEDAQWWLLNSGGDVKIAVVILIWPAQRTLLTEKWCLSPATGHSAIPQFRQECKRLSSRKIPCLSRWRQHLLSSLHHLYQQLFGLLPSTLIAVRRRQVGHA